jgi:MerR family transcriptional regulator, thiopeptide resistance regulator
MDSAERTYTVGEVARIAHVSIRSLRHYDELGLLKPSRRSDAGYRLYTSEDLERLQEVLFFKELGFGLRKIHVLMADPAHDRREALIAQRRELVARALRLEAMAVLIDDTLTALEEGIAMKDEELFGVFGTFDPSEHAEEARERWGGTAAYQESARRTKRYTKDDWRRYKTESDALHADIAALMDLGVPPDDPRVMDAAERHRLQIDRWFYPCDHATHAGLGRMYVADARFAATYEAIRPGMARYFSAAIVANVERAGAEWAGA